MIFIAVPGAVLVAVVLWDVFETIVLPRRVERTVRLTRYFFQVTWWLWRRAASAVRTDAGRETVLGVYGPLSLLGLIAWWATVLIFGYALIYLAVGSIHPLRSTGNGFATDVYFSGTAFVTLVLGDVDVNNGAAHAVSVVEAANGLAFLAVVIGYLPVFYSAFSAREINISLLDARAGSPPSAGELLRRLSDDPDALVALLRDWERWSAELLEGHLSYPVLMFFRSQHERQSWVAAITAILDTGSVIIVCGSGAESRAAQLTFAMARHAVVDLSAVVERAPSASNDDRLPPDQFAVLEAVVSAHPRLAQEQIDAPELATLRITYEPYVTALSRYLLMPLPAWVPAEPLADDWQTSRVEPTALGLADPIPDRRLRPRG